MEDIRRLIRHHSKEIKIGLFILLAVILLIVLYKSLFYSSSESAVYGVRIRDIKDNKITTKTINGWKESVLDIDKITECKIVIKGRLIKFFVSFDEDVSTDDIKNKFNETIKLLPEKVIGYYDITFYAKQNKDSNTKYPVIGYKHKNSDSISFDTF